MTSRRSIVFDLDDKEMTPEMFCQNVNFML